MDLISSSILGPICERVINTVIEEYKLARNVKEEIKNLCKTVSMIQGVLDDAERKQVENGAIRDWLKSQKQVLYDAEDILDEIATDEALRKRDADGTCRSIITRRLSKVRKLISCLCSVSTRHDVAHQIKDIEKEFDDISKLKDSLGLRVPDENSWSVIRTRRRQQETCSLLPREAHIIGRDDEMQKIEKLVLLESVEGTSDNKNVHVITVVGMGGVGKTTLVQHVYNNPAVTEYFQLRMWVCVSNDFDLKRITREIMDAASSSEKAKEIINDNSNWDAAQKSLQGKLEGKRFLLVLDDVWEEDPLKWDNLCIPLMYGGKGSIIIVTTRSQKVSNITKAGTSAIVLKDLSSKDLWTVFKNYAFDGHDPNKHTELVDVGGQIVEKLKGSPLAAKTIGRLLNSNLDVEHWTNILKSEAWVSSHHENSILPILKLSYDHLPGHLKQCFAYCSLFPEDHVFYKNKLVQLWTAQQFIRPTREVSHLESAGGEYFDNLVDMSLFEKHTYYEEAYVMHDLIHNLAESVSDGDCLRLEENQQKRITIDSETIRHVSSNRFDPIKIEEVCKYENTQTLLFLRAWQSQLDPDHLHNMFMKLQRLRVLGLSGCNFRKLPASIGTLK
ncbi:hypothetical protein Taro_044340, partial [Colocasia esculenta]|nr:hypothetical protein [Colocasia esculenta]